MFMPRSVLDFELDFRNWQKDPNRPRGDFVGSPPLNLRCKKNVEHVRIMSALPPKADIAKRGLDLRFVPKERSITLRRRP